MDTEEQTNPLVMKLKHLRDSIKTVSEYENWEEEEAQTRARSVLSSANIPARFKSASINDFHPDSHTYKFAKWVRPGSKGALIEGKTGAGKTHAACAIANWYARHGRSVRFVSFVRYVEAAQRRFSDADRDLCRVARYSSLLVIDDLGKEVVNKKTLPLIFDLINDRYENNRTTVITTNYSPAELQRIYEAVEPETGLAIMRRISEMCLNVEVRR